ncbi:hypothetical protein [Paracoccus sp. MC1862]|uniref:hypothetical protein n=1 Tax=Paracoccus sp. MC1862 TaxID=2760307 RepID=UPI001602B00F|nr:hypothetical protein [Paracoccus sp. MC1862]MBB1499652.1 hypothetical protein [Paracoccus sp. MC1862]
MDDAIGYRAASVTDFWTGTSRWSDDSQKVVRETLEMLGPKAFPWLRKAENLVQDVVSYAKTTIIRSVVVAVGNILSNTLHLALAGAPITQIAKGSRAKFSESTEFVKNREELQRLQVQAAAAALDPQAMKPIAARIRALEEANRHLSIAPCWKRASSAQISRKAAESVIEMPTRQARSLLILRASSHPRPTPPISMAAATKSKTPQFT